MSEEEKIDEQSENHTQQSTEETKNIFRNSIHHTTPDTQHNTENMEVHHPHHITHKKKWTEYLLEFFMLFLAVFLGFVTENIREHYVEKGREKQYAQSLYNDLKQDTARLGFIRAIKLWKGGKLDSLKSFLASANLQDHAKLIYYYSLFINLNQKFYTQDATIQQLRNSGSLRYFRNQELYNDIVHYYTMCQFFLDREMESENQILFPSEIIAKLFDTKILMSNLSVGTVVWKAIQMPEGNPQLLTTDKQILNQYYLFIANKKWINDVSLLFLGSIEKMAGNLMSKIKNEYNVK
jgi:hypothetical protein